MGLLKNRSIPESTIMPVLGYADVPSAANWLCEAFGFTARLRVGKHRVQLMYGDGAMVVAFQSGPVGHGVSVMVRVTEIDRHCERARRCGALIVQEPQTHAYGERQYTAEDPGGRLWTFTQTIADVEPAVWGGELL
ncbi:MAG TPA: VOC family protein [Burkholderiaceae bacterium]|jgi:uncharacterized glyoxalase superfamily protein PhnB